jgi:hypothetical protein
VGQIGSPAALRRSPDIPYRAARRAYPASRFAAMKWVNIRVLWYNTNQRGR